MGTVILAALAIGGSTLAGTGCGIYKDAAEGYNRLAVQERVLQPDPEEAHKYAKLFEEYKKIAANLGDAYGL